VLKMPLRITVRSKIPANDIWIDEFDMEFGDRIEVCVVTTKN